MKRTLIAAVVGGLVMFFVPQAATADHNAEHKTADQKSECAGQPAGASESPEQQTPPERHGDSEEEHSDGGEILF
jgi:hypothetical protein